MVERHRAGALERRHVARPTGGDTIGILLGAEHEQLVLLVARCRTLSGLGRGPERALPAAPEIAEAADVDDAGGIMCPQLELEVGAEAATRGVATDPLHQVARHQARR